ncbi:MAG: hypothetical protein CL840_10945 [Crocinitomicaceae bacterium]|nr:hypothetical protein [Crocinitomicaceae bacterium]|tara:strand:+ start:19631 stop:20200 length:570 start_codon:yes stop_codon:yes gene_type:complete
MKIRQPIIAYLVIILHVFVGLFILISTKKLPLPTWINSSVVVLVLLAIVNLIGISIFKLKTEFLEYWRLRKIGYLFVGMFGGTAIGLFPELLSVIAGNEEYNGQFNVNLSISAILITLVIVAWEELWFRGMFLNYCHRFLSPMHLSIIIGVLFMAVHALNPEMNLLVSGPGLFFAGAFLTILYFAFRTI